MKIMQLVQRTLFEIEVVSETIPRSMSYRRIEPGNWECGRGEVWTPVCREASDKLEAAFWMYRTLPRH